MMARTAAAKPQESDLSRMPSIPKTSRRPEYALEHVREQLRPSMLTLSIFYVGFSLAQIVAAAVLALAARPHPWSISSHDC